MGFLGLPDAIGDIASDITVGLASGVGMTLGGPAGAAVAGGLVGGSLALAGGVLDGDVDWGDVGAEALGGAAGGLIGGAAGGIRGGVMTGIKNVGQAWRAGGIAGKPGSFAGNALTPARIGAQKMAWTAFGRGSSKHPRVGVWGARAGGFAGSFYADNANLGQRPNGDVHVIPVVMYSE